MPAAKVASLFNGRYSLGEVLGVGGMATVYAATDTSLNRDVAIKVFTPSSDHNLVQRQEDEVAVLASLNHHGLVTLLDAGVDRSDRKNIQVFFVMELVTGADLFKTITKGQLDPRDIALIGYDIAEALQYVHSRDVVHLDIKPSNILFVDYYDDGTRARAKLTDFGIAQRGVSQLNDEPTTTGTAAYLSPEQVAREPVGAPSDIYSLGLVLLECFTRKLEYPGEPTQSALRRLERSPRIPASLSPGWRDLLSAMTAREPAARPAAKDVVLAMRKIAVEAVAKEVAASKAVYVPSTDDFEDSGDNPFDRITAMAARIFSAPIAIMALVDTGRDWIKSYLGVDLAQLEQETGRYRSANIYRAAWIPEDASTEPHVLADPHVAAKLGLGFYISVPLTHTDGTVIGALCVLDFEPRTISDSETATLYDLAAMAMNEFDSRLRIYIASKRA